MAPKPVVRGDVQRLVADGALGVVHVASDAEGPQ